VKTSELQIGARVRVYRNLHTGNFSVQCAKTGLVVAHVSSIALTNVTFVVRKAGRQKVLAQKKKNVHAFVVGNVCSLTGAARRQVKYNPYVADCFYLEERKEKISSAAFAELVNNKIFV